MTNPRTASAIPTLPAPLHAAFANHVRAALGLVFSPAREINLVTGVLRATIALGMSDPAKLLERLAIGDATTVEALAIELTVGETYFLRDAHHFEVLRNRVLPEALARRSAGARVRLWSAGCATGEEAYSLAIIALEALGPDAGDRIEIIATDLNPTFLRRAIEGWYGAWSFRRVDPAIQERWFRPDGKGWRIAPELQRMVKFTPLNLIAAYEHEWPGEIDAVFCRNVLIYFDATGIARVFSGAAVAIVEGGWLFTGPSDPSPPAGLPFVAMSINGLVAYQRLNAPPIELPPISLAPVEQIRAPVIVAPQTARPPAPTKVAPAPPADALVMARRLADTGDTTGALRMLDAAIMASPPDAGTYVLRATVRQAAHDQRGAAEDCDRAILLDRTLAFAHLLAAGSRSALGDSADARRALRNARALLAVMASDAVVPHAAGATAGALRALCDQLTRAAKPPGDVRGSSKKGKRQQ